ncbi:MAG: BadF/BadG/BcrA/BcrD ATPase family protein [Chloroherpetonaceae bacterium]|nr:BadF/BadG/BcrA/BcrD ATPase family protein [Chloroherpetonaceae bacterium]
MPESPLIFDGGGTSLKVFRLSTGQSVPVLESISGNFNFQSGKRDWILSTLLTLLKKYQPESCYIGLAGIQSQNEKFQIQQHCGSYNPTVLSDLELAFLIHFRDEDGLLCILGSGSIYAAKIHGRLHKVGGYGKLIGDDGSAISIGLKALKAILQYWDGYDSESPRDAELFVHAFKEYFSDKKTLLDWLYQAENGSQILAPMVLRLSESGNKFAQAIIRDEAQEAAKSIQTLLKKVRELGIRSEFKVAFHGGLADHFPSYLKLIEKYSELTFRNN